MLYFIHISTSLVQTFAFIHAGTCFFTFCSMDNSLPKLNLRFASTSMHLLENYLIHFRNAELYDCWFLNQKILRTFEGKLTQFLAKISRVLPFLRQKNMTVTLEVVASLKILTRKKLNDKAASKRRPCFLCLFHTCMVISFFYWDIP